MQREQRPPKNSAYFCIKTTYVFLSQNFLVFAEPYPLVWESWDNYKIGEDSLGGEAYLDA